MTARGRRRLSGQVQRGFGLVELMVALVLGLLLIAAAVHVFLGNRASHRYNESLATLQDNARFVLHTLERDLRMAGYSGCTEPTTSAPSVAISSPYGRVNILASSTAVSGQSIFPNAIAQPGNNNLPGAANGTSNTLRLNYMRDPNVRITALAGSLSDDLQVSHKPDGWRDGDQLLVTDCRNADLFTATDVGESAIAHDATDSDGNSRNTQANLSRLYDTDARVYEPYGVIYYVADTQLQDNSGNAIPALYRKPVAPEVKNARALVNGISHLTFRYGIDDTGDSAPDDYVASGEVAEWSQVVAVRVGFLAESTERTGEGTGINAGKTRQIFDRTLDDLPEDGHLRRVFTTTVALRNQVP